MYLDSFLQMLKKHGIQTLYPCIHDLVQNGPDPDRFEPDEHPPNRQAVTMFLAAWCKHIGLEQDMYQDWLIAYSQDVLSAISKSSRSQIRHSTKSAIKYIHKSDVPFICDVEHNPFKAECSPGCPVYTHMAKAYAQRQEAEKQRLAELQKPEKVPEPDPASLPLKKRNKPQYDEAVSLIKQYLDQGYTKQAISGLLNNAGYTTITGLAWKASSVSNVAIEQGWAPKRKRRKHSS